MSFIVEENLFPIATAVSGPCTSTHLFPIGDMMLILRQDASKTYTDAGSAQPQLGPQMQSILDSKNVTLVQDANGTLFVRVTDTTLLPSGQTMQVGTYEIASMSAWDPKARVYERRKIAVDGIINEITDQSTTDLDAAIAACVAEHVRIHGFEPPITIKARSPVEAILRTLAAEHQLNNDDPTSSFYRAYAQHVDSIQVEQRHAAMAEILRGATSASLEGASLEIKPPARPQLGKLIVNASIYVCNEHLRLRPALAFNSIAPRENSFQAIGGSLIHLAEEVTAPLRQLLAQTCGYAAIGYGFVCVCEKPTSLALDEFGLPHNENGPSITFSDGWRLFHWHGLLGSRTSVTGTPTLPSFSFRNTDDETLISIERYGAEQCLDQLRKNGSSSVLRSPFAPADHPVPMLRNARLISVNHIHGPAFLEINAEHEKRMVRVDVKFQLLGTKLGIGDIERAFQSLWFNTSGKPINFSL